MNHTILPNFYVVGCQKSGTTSLHHYLGTHPDIFLPAQKETKFFIKDEIYKQGIQFYKSRFFSACNNESAIGEVDPDIIYFDYAMDRLHLIAPHAKLIFVFRNPVERAFSHYLMTYRRGREPLDFSEAIRHEAERIKQGFIENMDYSYMTRGYYAHQVERFLSRFDRSKMLFILSEDLRNNAEQCLERCYRFLGVDDKYLPANLQKKFHRASIPKNVALYRAVRYQSPLRKLARLVVPGKKMRKSIREAIYAWNTTDDIRISMAEKTRHDLIELYRDENLRLGTLIGRDLSHWNR